MSVKQQRLIKHSVADDFAKLLAALFPPIPWANDRLEYTTHTGCVAERLHLKVQHMLALKVSSS